MKPARFKLDSTVITPLCAHLATYNARSTIQTPTTNSTSLCRCSKVADRKSLFLSRSLSLPARYKAGKYKMRE